VDHLTRLLHNRGYPRAEAGRRTGRILGAQSFCGWRRPSSYTGGTQATVQRRDRGGLCVQRRWQPAAPELLCRGGTRVGFACSDACSRRRRSFCAGGVRAHVQGRDRSGLRVQRRLQQAAPEVLGGMQGGGRHVREVGGTQSLAAAWSLGVGAEDLELFLLAVKSLDANFVPSVN
jgi:hypothetical protein